jgi:gamma-D-glutamyl-L-lysine dipeptidyl-peptidase
MRCAVDVAPLRAEPDDRAEQVTQALRGEPLEPMGERQGRWLRVVTAYDYPGWVREEQVEGGSGGFPPALIETPIDAARGLLGTRYEWGGMTERGIDCSGLVHMAYRLAGRLVPRDAHEQDYAGREVSEPVPGDLATYGDPVDHVAFWLGGGRILHSTGRDGGIGVVEEPEPPELVSRRRRFVRL